MADTRSSEGVEDLTGGVTSELYTCDVLDKDRFWKEELLLVNKDFLFAASILGNVTSERSGIISGHAYSVLKAREVKGKRFVLIRYHLPCPKYQSDINYLLSETHGDLPSGPVHGAMVQKSGQLNG